MLELFPFEVHPCPLAKPSSECTSQEIFAIFLCPEVISNDVIMYTMSAGLQRSSGLMTQAPLDLIQVISLLRRMTDFSR